MLVALLLLLGAPDVPDGPLTLEEAMDFAERNTRDVVRARADMLLVDIERARAYANLQPSLNLFFTATEVFNGAQIVEGRFQRIKRPGCLPPENCGTFITEGGGPYDLEYGEFYDAFSDPVSQPSFVAGFSARQLIYDGGRWWTLIARADDIEDQLRAALRTFKSSARLDALRRFYDLARALEGVRVSELQVRLAEAQLRRVRGEGKHNEIATAERNVANDRVSLARRQFAASNATRALNLAMGRTPEAALTITLPPEVATATVAEVEVILPGRDRLLETAQELRPEIQQTRAVLKVVEKNIQLRRGDNWPIISLVATYTRSSRRPDRVFNDPTENFVATIGLDIRWNLFSGGATRLSIEEGELDLLKAQASYEDLLRLVKSQTLEKAEEIQLLIEVHRLNLAGARSAQEAFAGVEASYKQGNATTLELRDAEQRLIQALLEATVGRMNIEVAKAELARVIGADLEAATNVFAFTTQ